MPAAPHRFEGRFAPTLTVAVVALIPFVLITGAQPLLQPATAAGLDASLLGLHISAGLAMAAYVFGALLGGDLADRLPQRGLFLACELLFTLGAAGAALAPRVFPFAASGVLQGASTGVLLIAALPPVIRNFPVRRMAATAAAVNIGFFGAATAGPWLGGWLAGPHAWRWLYGGAAFAGAGVLILAGMTWPEKPALEPAPPPDKHALGLALAATFVPFFAAAQLATRPFHSIWFWLPLTLGVVFLLRLIQPEHRKSTALVPVMLLRSAYPLFGILAAMVGGAAFIVLLDLAEQLLVGVGGWRPVAAGAALWPVVAALLGVSLVLGWALSTRWLPVLIASGLAALLAAGALLWQVRGGGMALTIAALLLGWGAGATVGPGFWLAAFSVPARLVGRALAALELMRSEAVFILAAVLLRAVREGGGSAVTLAGVHRGLAWMLALLAATGVALAWLYLAGAGGRLDAPALGAWLQGSRPALLSPPLGARSLH